MSTKIYFNGTRFQVKQKIRQLVHMLTGRQPDWMGIAKSFQATVGAAALEDIKDAYLVKSAGGTDEMGLRWPPLSQTYLAYGRRFQRGEVSALKSSQGLGRGHHHAPGGNKGLLNFSQRMRWNQIYHSMVNKLSLSLPISEAKATAAKIAWSIVKREGGLTKKEVYGNRVVPILYDTGKLFNSLKPGIVQGDTYVKPPEDGGNDQVFEFNVGRFTIGSKVKYAGAHQNGIIGKLPRRQFLPDNESQIPTSWWKKWLQKGAEMLEQKAQLLFRK